MKSLPIILILAIFALLFACDETPFYQEKDPPIVPPQDTTLIIIDTTVDTIEVEFEI